MRRAARIAFVVSLVAGEVAAVLLLHRLGRAPGFAVPRHAVGRWVLHAPTEDLFAVAARLAGLALGWWLLAATVLSVGRRAVPGWRRLHALDLVTPATLRHALDRAFVLGLGASLTVASVNPAGANAPPRGSPISVSVTTRPRPIDEPVPRTPAGSTGGPRARTPAPAAQPATALPGARAVLVRAGDNLWVIARRELRDHGHSGASPAPVEIVPYWRRVIAANAATLRSHDPNLIFPGERVLLPPFLVQPTRDGEAAPG